MPSNADVACNHRHTVQTALTTIQDQSNS